MPISDCPLEDNKLRALLTYYMKDLAGYAGLTLEEKKILNVVEFERLRAWAFHGPTEVAKYDLEELHRQSSHHKLAIENSLWCACFFCLNVFTPDKIVEWALSEKGEGSPSCAVCPYCSVDAVLPSSTVKLSKEMLQAMHNHWFAEMREEKKNAASQDPQAPQELLAQAPSDDREGAREAKDEHLSR